MEVPIASSPRTATPPRLSNVPFLVRAAAAAVGCSRVGARCRYSGRLFPSRCALPLRRSAVPALVGAAIANVWDSPVRERCRCGGPQFLSQCKLVLLWCSVSDSGCSVAAAVSWSFFGARLCWCGRLPLSVCAAPRLWPDASAEMRASVSNEFCSCSVAPHRAHHWYISGVCQCFHVRFFILVFS